LQVGAGVDCILQDPIGKRFIIACRLEFECINNTVEYETLLQGLKKVVDLKVKHIKVFGDYEIVVHQVNNTIHCNSWHLKNYQHEVWWLKSMFEFFEINVIPRNKNIDVDLLENVASRLLPSEGLITDRFYVELLFRPSIPDNVINWRVFDDDVQLL